MNKKHISVLMVAFVLTFFSCQKKTIVSSPKYDSGGVAPQASHSSSKSKKSSSKKGSYSTQPGKAKEEYEKRVIEVAKAKAKKNKAMKKPQYSIVSTLYCVRTF